MKEEVIVRLQAALRRPPLGSIALVLTVVAGACGGAQGQPPSSAVAAPTAAPATPGTVPASGALPPTPLRVRVMHSAVSGSQALLSVVQEAGLFTRQGLEVEVVTGTPRTASAGLIAGESPIVVG